ncbi:MAG: hypothetical protein RLZZ450_2954 [Pseudomonadota bacterium]|jgi:hypothetical protein
MKTIWIILALTVAGVGCADESQQAGHTAPMSDGNDQLRGLTMALTAVDSQGRQYRLRNATFTIQTPYYNFDGGTSSFVTVASTESDPNAYLITTRLQPNLYSVTLGGDWYIERWGLSGPERVAQSALLTDPTQYVNLYSDTLIGFRFGVDGTAIDFRYADLAIQIFVELPGELSSDGGVVLSDSGYH